MEPIFREVSRDLDERGALQEIWEKNLANPCGDSWRGGRTLSFPLACYYRSYLKLLSFNHI